MESKKFVECPWAGHQVKYWCIKIPDIHVVELYPWNWNISIQINKNIIKDR